MIYGVLLIYGNHFTLEKFIQGLPLKGLERASRGRLVHHLYHLGMKMESLILVLDVWFVFFYSITFTLTFLMESLKRQGMGSSKPLPLPRFVKDNTFGIKISHIGKFHQDSLLLG